MIEREPVGHAAQFDGEALDRVGGRAGFEVDAVRDQPRGRAIGLEIDPGDD
ncbi:MAG: hypothetical protein JWN66_3460, partial [Sphingomonas bacterium]|nr:hypothetical protein [Sphingomonas bacterium]